MITKSSLGSWALIAILSGSLVWAATAVELQAGSIAAVFGYGTVVTLLMIASSEYRLTARRPAKSTK
ncbi:MAG: hypothetical protein FJ382_05875 [Verrucomicrobia bacterium]|nr:hypothetical protein [Verrucomicrobiota bacterium]